MACRGSRFLRPLWVLAALLVWPWPAHATCWSKVVGQLRVNVRTRHVVLNADRPGGRATRTRLVRCRDGKTAGCYRAVEERRFRLWGQVSSVYTLGSHGRLWVVSRERPGGVREHFIATTPSGGIRWRRTWKRHRRQVVPTRVAVGPRHLVLVRSMRMDQGVVEVRLAVHGLRDGRRRFAAKAQLRGHHSLAFHDATSKSFRFRVRDHYCGF